MLKGIRWLNAVSSEKRKYELKARAEKLGATRQRIVEATSALHEEVGPARTTIAEIARRAGVQRLTVYNHFPDDKELFAACGAYWLAANMPPDPAPFLAIRSPSERLRAFLRAFYAWFRAHEAGLTRIQRDRLLLPALDEAARENMDRPLASLVDTLSRGLGGRGTRPRTRAAVALALDLWAWRRLTSEGLDDDAAADVMVGMVLASARRQDAAAPVR